MFNPLKRGIMKKLEQELKQLLLGLNYKMRTGDTLITISVARFISDHDLSMIMDACHKRNCIVYIFPCDESHFELSICER